MKRPHVAIFNAPLRTTVNPSLTIVQTLVRRGYRVTYVTSNRFAAELAKLGAEIVLIPNMEFPYTQAANLSLPMEHQYSNDLLDLAARTLSQVSSFYRENVPSFVLYEQLAYAGLVLAEQAGVPAIRISSHLAFDEEVLKHLPIKPHLRQALNQRRENVDEFLKQHGVHRRDAIFIAREPTVYSYVKDLQLPQRADHGLSLYAGRCAAERPYLGTWKSARADDKRAILITASTTHMQGPQYYAMCMEALAGLGWHAVLAVGASFDAESLQPLPADCEVVRNTPLSVLMPHVELLIGLGGMAITMEALYHGLPQLMLTHGVQEAEWYAQNVQSHGLGIHLSQEQTSAASIRGCVVQMSEDSAMRARVKRMQDKVRRSAGGEEAVNWIEEYLASPQSARM